MGKSQRDKGKRVEGLNRWFAEDFWEDVKRHWMIFACFTLIFVVTGVRLLLVGLMLGAPIVFLVTVAVRTALQGLVPIDATGALPMVAILVVVTLLATYLPAHRAAAMEPTTALRDD